MFIKCEKFQVHMYKGWSSRTEEESKSRTMEGEEEVAVDGDQNRGQTKGTGFSHRFGFLLEFSPQSRHKKAKQTIKINRGSILVSFE